MTTTEGDARPGPPEVQPVVTWVRAHARAVQNTILGVGLSILSLWHIAMLRGTIPFSDELRIQLEYHGLFTKLFVSRAGWANPLARLVMNGFIGVWGMHEYLPLRLFGLACNLLVAAAAVVYLRRIGRPWLAVAVPLYLMVLGSAFHNLLWPASALTLPAVAAIPFSLVLLMPNRRRLDVLLAALLVPCVLFTGAETVPVLVGMLVFLLGSRAPLVRYATVVPAIVTLGALHLFSSSDETPFGVPFKDNFFGIPKYLFESASGTVAGMFGVPSDAGPALLVVVVVLLGYGASRLDVDARVRCCALAASAITYWGITAIGRGHLHEPGAPRYMMLGVLCIVLIACEVTKAWRWQPATVVAAALVLLFAAFGNAALLRTHGASFRYQASFQRGELAGLELGRRTAKPDYMPDKRTMPSLAAGRYFDAIARLGSPAYSLKDLRHAPRDARGAADKVLFEVHNLAFEQTTPDSSAFDPDCKQAPLDRGLQTVDRKIGRRGVVVRTAADGTAVVRVRRFGDRFLDQFPVDLDRGFGTRIRVVDDRSSVPWKIEVIGRGFAICPP